jgi:sodium/bile acid cotransporter 7
MERSRAKFFVELLEDQWFILLLGVVIAIASQVQVPKSQQKLKSTVVSYTCVSIIFFLTGCTLKTRTLLENYSRWKLNLFVQAQSFLMTSAIMFGVVSACATNPNFMDPGILLGLLMTGCLTTTISSNVVMTGRAHGNQPLTVVSSTVGSFLGPFLSPALFAMYTSTGAWYTKVLPFDSNGYGQLYRRVFKQLGLSIFVPMERFSLIRLLCILANSYCRSSGR